MSRETPLKVQFKPVVVDVMGGDEPLYFVNQDVALEFLSGVEVDLRTQLDDLELRTAMDLEYTLDDVEIHLDTMTAYEDFYKNFDISYYLEGAELSDDVVEPEETDLPEEGVSKDEGGGRKKGP